MLLLHNFQRDPRTNLEGKQFIHSFSEGDISKRTKIMRAPCRRNPESRGDRTLRATKFWGCRYSGSQSSQRRERIEITPSICGIGTQFGHSLDTELSVPKQDSTRYDEKFAANKTSPQSHLGVVYIGTSVEFTEVCEYLT